MSNPRTLCGPHTDIVKTDGVRITRCPCGTLHVNLARNGTTVQFAPEYFAEVAHAFGLAHTLVSGRNSDGGHVATSASGKFVTVETFDPKKSSN